MLDFDCAQLPSHPALGLLERAGDEPIRAHAAGFLRAHEPTALQHAQVLGERGQVEDLVRKKFAVTDRPGRARGQAVDSRNIPAEVQRKVYLRDRGRCAYLAPDGRRCGERAFLEFHHIHPHADGGLPTVENISLRCRAHNQYEAAIVFGFGIGVAHEPMATYGRVKAPTFSFRNENLSGHPRSATRSSPA